MDLHVECDTGPKLSCAQACSNESDRSPRVCQRRGERVRVLAVLNTFIKIDIELVDVERSAHEFLHGPSVWLVYIAHAESAA